MAAEPQGKADHQGHHRSAQESPNGPPPPSTLAAQLVQSITTSTRPSALPDETNELKRLFAVIERIKNQPEALKSNRERIEHNHMLIYVYTRVVLEGLKWDDPFANHTNVCAEALKAISFLQITINETPAVLNYTTDGTAFLSRGQEPLWLWLLPRVLRMLGLNSCRSLTPMIQQLCQSFLTASQRNGTLWRLHPAVQDYFQGNFSG